MWAKTVDSSVLRLKSYVLSPRIFSLAWILLIKLRRLTAASVFESLSFLCAFPARCLLWFQPVTRNHSFMPRRFIPRFCFVSWGVRLVSTTPYKIGPGSEARTGCVSGFTPAVLIPHHAFTKGREVVWRDLKGVCWYEPFFQTSRLVDGSVG